MRHIDTMCSFENFYVEPLSHTILNGVGRSFLELLVGSESIWVCGKQFNIPTKLLRMMDKVISGLRRHGSFTRPFATLLTCASVHMNACWVCFC